LKTLEIVVTWLQQNVGFIHKYISEILNNEVPVDQQELTGLRDAAGQSIKSETRYRRIAGASV
jgi:hypothetical protein